MKQRISKIALAFALVSVLFPEQVFGLLTNHTEVNQLISSYMMWLLPLLVFTAVAFMLEGYFIGLKAGGILRNAVLFAFGLGFLPLAIAAWCLHNNHLLWLGLVSYMATTILVLALKLSRTLDSENLKKQELLTSS